MSTVKIVPSQAAFDDLFEQEKNNYWNMAALAYASTKLPGESTDAATFGPTAAQRIKLVHAWKWAITNGHTTEANPGDTVDLPTVEFPNRYK